MASILVLYGTGEGQTRKIAARIRTTLSEMGHSVQIRDVETISLPFDVTDFDLVIVGSPIHRGTPRGSILTFLQQTVDDLNTMPSAYFQVSLSSASPNEAQQKEALTYIESLLDDTGWEPDRIAQFGGALRYSEYGFLTTIIMRRIAKGVTGDTDTSRDYEYTDWEAVDDFSRAVSTLVAT